MSERATINNFAEEEYYDVQIYKGHLGYAFIQEQRGILDVFSCRFEIKFLLVMTMNNVTQRGICQTRTVACWDIIDEIMRWACALAARLYDIISTAFQMII